MHNFFTVGSILTTRRVYQHKKERRTKKVYLTSNKLI